MTEIVSDMLVSKCLLPDTSVEGHNTVTAELRSQCPLASKNIDPCDTRPDWKVAKLNVVKYWETLPLVLTSCPNLKGKGYS